MHRFLCHWSVTLVFVACLSTPTVGLRLANRLVFRKDVSCFGTLFGCLYGDDNFRLVGKREFFLLRFGDSSSVAYHFLQVLGLFHPIPEVVPLPFLFLFPVPQDKLRNSFSLSLFWLLGLRLTLVLCFSAVALSGDPDLAPSTGFQL